MVHNLLSNCLPQRNGCGFVRHICYSYQVIWVERNLENSMSLVRVAYISGVSCPSTHYDIQKPSHGRVFREKFHSVYVVKGV